VIQMATFSTYAEVLTPDHPLMKPGRAVAGGGPPGIVLADILRRTGGAHETTTPLTEEFRGYIRAAAELTSDDELLRIAELPEVPVSLENCRQLGPQTRIAMFCRLDVSPAETPRWRRIPPGGIPATPRSGIDGFLRAGLGARIEEHALPDGRFWRYVGPAGNLPRHLRRDQGHASD
jgi:hypothetical protein